MKMNSFVFLLVLLIASCKEFEPEAKVVDSNDAQQMVNSIVYKQDARTKICYGILETTRLNTSISASNSISITYVPCNLVPEFKTDTNKVADKLENAVNELLK